MALVFAENCLAVQRRGVESFRDRLERLSNQTIQQASSSYASLLRHCAGLAAGKEIHSQLVNSGFDTDTFLGNLLVQMYGKFSSLAEAQAAFDRIQQPNVFSWTLLLTAYAQNGHLDSARKVFEETPLPDLVSWTTLVASYARAGHFAEARALFNRMPQKNVVSWNSLITGYAQRGHEAEAMQLFRLLNLEGVRPNSLTFTGIFAACSGVPNAASKMVVEVAVESGYSTIPFVGTSAVHTMGKAGLVFDARQLFNRIIGPTLASWNAMVAVYANNGCVAEAWQTFALMDLEGEQADEISFLNALNACDETTAWSGFSAMIQAEIQDSNFGRSKLLATALITSYARTGDLEAARAEFYGIPGPDRDLVAYTAMVRAYSMHGESDKVLQVFGMMDLEGVAVDHVIYASLLDACSKNSGSVRQGRMIHELAVESGVPIDLVLATSMLTMYAKCGSIREAWEVFEAVRSSGSSSTAVTWNAMISALSRNDLCDEAVELFREMSLEGIKATSSTVVSVLEACSEVSQVELLRSISASLGVESQVAASLVTAFGVSGDLDRAREVFDRWKLSRPEVVLWTAMVAALARSGEQREALEIFRKMELEGVKGDEVTLMAAIDVLDVKFVRARAAAMGLDSLLSGIISSYSRSGEVELALQTFGSVDEHRRDAAAYNALLGALAASGDGSGATRVAALMDQTGVKLDEISFLALIEATARGGDLREARRVHSRILDAAAANLSSKNPGAAANVGSKNMGTSRTPGTSSSSSNKLGNALVSLYGRCGDVAAAVRVFREPWMERQRDSVTWNAIIACHAQNGRARECVELFWEMRLDGRHLPDAITFSVLLSACSHAGFVDHAHHCWLWLREIVRDPALEHYVCMVDVLARSGQLARAQELVESMPYEPDELVWKTLSGSSVYSTSLKQRVVSECNLAVRHFDELV